MRVQVLYSRQLRAICFIILSICLTFLIILTPASKHLDNADQRLVSISSPTTAVPTCLPHTHVFFLKTHKCASSTLQNIFLRYGYMKNLTFALPSGANYLGNPGDFKYSMIPKYLMPTSGKVDIFAVHTRLSPDHNKVMPEDTKWVTAVREPVSLYESLFNFFGMKNSYKFNLDEMATKPLEELMKLPRYGDKFGKNQMLFDMGYKDNMTVAELMVAIKKVDKKFDLVLVAEHLDESLILLKELLCWSLHDVVFFTKNARRADVKKEKMPLETREAILQLNSADSLLYNHFLAKHKLAVEKFGIQKMADEVASLRGLRDEYFEDCGVKEVKGKDPSLEFKEYSGLVSSYVIGNNTDENCLVLSLPELPLLSALRKYQKEKFVIEGHA
ncbi:unnamed protein product [Meganyctiphanes norvegica]|uniref:Galactosylceramide sulfotransferase-like n=1 Tax=Meganyctiphanes norvegica TaxID=48144 RepID=A0AAV2QJK1_MEGNR